MTPQPDTARDGAIAATGFPIRLLTTALVLTAVSFGWFGWIILDESRDAKRFQAESLRVEELRGVIVHLDEVLTMSARMAAETGDPKWEERYRRFEPQLDAAIKETIRLGTTSRDLQATTMTDEANVKLVEMENRLFGLVRAGRKEEAQAVSFSPEYEAQKKIYADGITSFAEQVRGEVEARQRQRKHMDFLSMIIGSLVVLAISFVAWLSVVRSLQRWRADLLQAISRRQQAEQALQQANKDLEARIQQRTAELEKANQNLQGEITERQSTEKQLRVQSTALDAAANAIVITDHDGTIQSVNPAFTALTGYTAQEAVGQNPRILKSGTQNEAFYRNLWQAISSGQVWSGQLTNRRKDGSLYAEEMTITPLRDAGGAIARYIAIKQDITERKRAEEALRQSEEQFRAMFDLASVGIAQADPRTGQWVRVNQKMCEITGYSAGELLQMRIADITHPKDRLSDRAAFERVVRGEAPDYRMEKRYLRKDGALAWVNVNMTVIRNAAGQPTRTVAAIEDITERKRATEELQWNTALLEAQVNSSPDGILVVDQEKEKLFHNQRFVELFRIPDRVANEKDNERRLQWVADGTTHPEEYIKIVRHLYAHPAEISRDEIELKDGMTLDRYSSPVVGKDGKYYGRIWTFRDVTAGKKAEEALRRSETKFRTLYDAASDALMLSNEKGFFDCNPAALAMFGCATREEFCSKHPADVSPPMQPGGTDSLTLARQQIATAMEKGSHHFEWMHQRADTGEAFPAEVLLSAMELDGKRVLQATVRDITARKQAEEKLKLFRMLIDQSNDCIFVVDHGTGRFLDVNQSACRELGYTRQELLGLTVFEVTMGVDRAVFEARNAQIDKAGHATLETLHRRKDGTTFPAEVSLSFVTLDKKYQVVIGRNITERKRFEANLFQSQKMETVGKLAGGIAHEFNSIMTAIIGQSELMLYDLPAGNPLRKNAAEIHQAADRAATLTCQLLAYGRKQILQPEILDLNTVLAGMENTLRHLAGRDVDVQIAPPTGPKLVKADAGQIEQVIVNIVMNAADAMPRGGKLTLETAETVLDQQYVSQFHDLKAGDYVRLAITDTGAGMSEAVKARLFEPFFTTKEVGQGTGLGLATCHGIIKQSGGHINVYSEPGRGATFKIYLPKALLEEKTPGPPLPAPGLPRGTETILLVEDDPALREMAAALLGRLGYTVWPAGNGLEALNVTHQRATGHIDLLFTDVVMPHMSGKELSDRIQALYPRTKVLFTSAYTENAIVHQGVLNAGITLLQKPFTPSALAGKVREVLDHDKPAAPL